jgi:hypothetical protein
MEEYAFSWSTAVYFFLAVFYLFCVVRILDRVEHRFKAKKPLSDSACLNRLSMIRNCSEFDLFVLAAEPWHIDKKSVDVHFFTYLKDGVIPYYIRDYIRRHKQEIDNHSRDKLPYRGSLPPSWSA